MSITKLIADLETERRNNQALGERLIARIDELHALAVNMVATLETMRAGVAKEIEAKDRDLVRIIEGDKGEAVA